MVTRDVSKLEINKLTKAQFERELAAGQINPDALYMVPSSNAVANYTATITTSWVGTEAPFSQEVTVAGILATDTPILDLVASATYQTAQSENEGWCKIYKAVTSANKITFYASEALEVALNFVAKVVR